MFKYLTTKPPLGDQPDLGPTQPRDDTDAAKDISAEALSSEPFMGRGPDLRLLVDTDEARGGLIYRLVNRQTGEVVSEITPDDLAKHNADPNYTGGAWLDTKA